MKAVRPRVSYADLERAPEDGRRYELYDGEVFVVPSPLPKHQVVALRIVEMVSEYVRQHGGFCVTSPIDIVFSEYDVLQPDVIFFSPARAHLVDINHVIATRRTCVSRCCRPRPLRPIAARRCRCSRDTVSASTGSSIPRQKRSRSSSSVLLVTNSN